MNAKLKKAYILGLIYRIVKRCELEGCRYDKLSPNICIYCSKPRKVIPKSVLKSLNFKVKNRRKAMLND